MFYNVGFLSTLLLTFHIPVYLFIYLSVYMFQIQVPSSLFQTFHTTLKFKKLVFFKFFVFTICSKKNFFKKFACQDFEISLKNMFFLVFEKGWEAKPTLRDGRRSRPVKKNGSLKFKEKYKKKFFEKTLLLTKLYDSKVFLSCFFWNTNFKSMKII
jgi:hypothetical protein